MQNGKHKSAVPLEFREITEPPPPRYKRGSKQEEAFKWFRSMELGRGVEVNRKPETVNSWMVLFRKRVNADVKFIVRPAKDGGSRVWRVK